MPPQPDRALRRLITELAGLDPEDLASVLDGLDAEERQTVSSLVAAYSEVAPDTAILTVGLDEPPLDGWAADFSPWLAARLQGAASTPPPLAAPLSLGEDREDIVERAPFFMTPAAAGALRAAAGAVAPRRTLPKRPPVPRRPDSLFGSLPFLNRGRP